MIKNLYVECTHTASSDFNTGIQRVVRNIISHLDDELANGAAVSLITLRGSGFHRLDELRDLREFDERGKFEDPVTEKTEDVVVEGVVEQRVSKRIGLHLKNKVLNVIRAVRMAILIRISWAPLHQFLSAPRHEFGLSRVVYSLIYRVFGRGEPAAKHLAKLETGSKPLVFSQGDVILMLDASWHSPAWEAIAKAKNDGAVVFVVIYDLIPITHSQFCEKNFCLAFSNWFQRCEGTFDGYIAISKTVRQSLISYLVGKGSSLELGNFGYFYLGADLPGRGGQYGNVRGDLGKNISKKDSYLMVSTIEPRKNHQYLIDAFSELWLKGCRVKLHIVGRIGWKVEELLSRMKEHPEFNKQLFLWHDLDDDELVYCYENSKSLVFSSYVEGFGLPIIEAQHHQLPVLASDTPIHREIGGDSIGYFDLNSPCDLADKIIAIEAGLEQLPMVGEFDFEQFTWRKSSEMLVEEIYRMKALL